MRPRRHHHDARSWPSGRPEVELFTFWENDLTSDVPADSTAVQPPASPADTPAGPWPQGMDPPPSAAPLWWAAAFAILFVLVALLA
jgi:hypothetical protein